VSLTWRDDVAIAGMSVGGLIGVVVAVGFAGVLAVRWRGRPGSTEREQPIREVGWADPETRPRF
jgi:hypothetical protein